MPCFLVSIHAPASAVRLARKARQLAASGCAGTQKPVACASSISWPTVCRGESRKLSRICHLIVIRLGQPLTSGTRVVAANQNKTAATAMSTEQLRILGIPDLTHPLDASASSAVTRPPPGGRRVGPAQLLGPLRYQAAAAGLGAVVRQRAPLVLHLLAGPPWEPCPSGVASK